MGLLSLHPSRAKEGRRNARLPMCNELNNKERYSDEYSSSEDDGSRTDYSPSHSPSSRSSRNTSRSLSSSVALMMSKTGPTLAAPAPARRPAARRYFYRLPNRVIRFLCMGMIATILLFMYSLVRASQLENRRMAEGTFERPKTAQPLGGPAWERFEFLKRYYGGVRNLKLVTEFTPEYPTVEDEQPYDGTRTSNPSEKESTNTTTTGEGSIVNKIKRDSLDLELGLETGKVPTTKVFASDYPGSTVPKGRGQIQECFLDGENKIQIPPIRYFDGRPNGFPQNIMGSYELFSLPEDICFDRYGRFGPYGFGYSIRSGGLGIGEHGDKEGAEDVWKTTKKIDWNNKKTDWADVQARCYKANEERFKPMVSRKGPPRGWYIGGNPQTTEIKTREKRADTGERLEEVGAPVVVVNVEKPSASPVDASTVISSSSTASPAATHQASTGASAATGAAKPASKPHGDAPRTAVVVRCWDEFWWNEEAVMSMRSLISELSLASGGKYDVHLLVQVKNDARDPVWADDEVYRNLIKERVPEEFQGLVTLWTETQMLSLYQGLYDLFTRGPDLPVHGSYRGLQMAMQYFAYNHPEYDYFWQWEMDIRYTGHYLDLFTKLENWAKEQPRKGLWERNARFYFPSVHGTWEDFKQMSRVQTEIGTFGADNIWSSIPGAKQDPAALKRGEETVWGPKRPVDEADWFEYENDPKPPTTYEKDKYVWGVGEEADLITLNPIFDPEGTTWGLSPDITGYNESEGIGKPPRRAQIITASRMSRRLLMTMHRETAFAKHHAFPEMWPATAALHHGLKAVFAPHPLFVDRAWPTEYMARVFNAGKNGASGGSRTSVFGDREHNLRGLTWFYDAGFSPNLYRRWLGLRVNNDGGEEFELITDMSKDESTVSRLRGGQGRMCLPPMLLHPIKDVELPVEEETPAEDEATFVEADPSS